VNIATILGSARGESDTQALLEAVLAGRPATRIDLRNLDIQQYEYAGSVARDDFGMVVETMITHTRIVFATPVYWYAMSGRMKVLFDRFTDLVTVRKDLGRRLKGRSVFVVACGSDARLPDGFEVPFLETAAYLEMTYGGAFYAQTDKLGILASARDQAAAFGQRVFA
jgi:multimeric flavodoxin WrbA